MLGLSALFSAGSYVSCQYLDLLPVSDSPRYQSKENEILRAAPYCLLNPRGSYSNTNLVSDIEEQCVMNKASRRIYLFQNSPSETRSPITLPLET